MLPLREPLIGSRIRCLITHFLMMLVAAETTMICGLNEDTINNLSRPSSLLACEAMVDEVVDFIIVGTRPKLKKFLQLEKCSMRQQDMDIYHRGQYRKPEVI